MSSSSRLITCSLLILFSQNNNQVLSLLNKPAFYHSRVTTRPLNRLAPIQLTGDLGVDLYDAQLTVSSFVETQLATASPTSIAFLYGAGLLTAFSPCSISLLPLTLAYLGGSESTKSNEVIEGKVDRTVLTRSALYASGLATTLTLFGLSAAMLGNVFGASGLVGDLSALLSSGLFLVMGLYLLGIVEIKFPSFDGKIGKASKESGGIFSNGSVQAFLFGATSALVASPCSSPVLTSLLAFVASSGDATIGLMKSDHSHNLFTVF
jgi:cytochrome c-type biogenesis protein